MTEHPFHSFDMTDYVRINGAAFPLPAVSNPLDIDGDRDSHLLHTSPGIQIYRRLNSRRGIDSLDFFFSGQRFSVKVAVDSHNADAPVTQSLAVLVNMRQGFLVRPAINTQVMTFITADEEDDIDLGPHIVNPCVIRSHGGNDEIHTEAHRTTVFAGDGDDRISVLGGRCYADGEEGNDDMYSANDGHVTFHGGPGNDTLEGSRHTARSFLDGGEGDDLLIGGQGPNIMVGGPGDDRLKAGDTQNVIYTGDGYNQVERLKPTDTTYHNVKSDLTVDCEHLSDKVLDRFAPGELASRAIHVEPRPLNPAVFNLHGSPHFIERAKDDLRLLLASPTGQKLIAVLEHSALVSGQPIEIHELMTDESSHFIPGADRGSSYINNGHAGTPSYGGSIYYSVQDVLDEMPSVITLFHELVHAYNYLTGTLLPGDSMQWQPDHRRVLNRELQAVGLPTEALPFDFDGDPATPPTDTNPEAFSENGLRRELGLPLRNHY